MTLVDSHSTRKGHAILWLTSPIWGSTFVAGEIATRDLPAVHHGYLRLLMACTLFGFVLAIRFLVFKIRMKTSWWKLAMIGFFGTSCFHLFHAWQLSLSEATQTAILVGLLPICLLGFSAFFLKEEITKSKIIGLLISLVGMVLVTDMHIKDFSSFSKPWQLLLASVLAGTAYSLGIIFYKRFKIEDSPFEVAGFATILGTCVLSVFLFSLKILSMDFFSTVWSYSHKSLLATFYLAAFGNLIAFSFYLFALRFVPAGDSGLFIFVEPLWAAFLSYLLFGRMVSPHLLSGGILLFSGVAIALYTKSVRRLFA